MYVLSWWSNILNQFPGIVMFGMNGFYVSASGTIQGHHGPKISAITFYLGNDAHSPCHLSVFIPKLVRP